MLVLAGAGAAVALAGVGQRVEQHDLLTHQISALTVNTGGGDVTVRTGGGDIELRLENATSTQTAHTGRAEEHTDDNQKSERRD